MRLSFEVLPPTPGDNGVQVEVYLDRAGRDYLVRELNKLNDINEHFHMFSEAWGAGELTVERRTSDSLVGHHVKIYLRPEGEAF